MLKNLNLKNQYDSDVDDPLNDFYIPILKEAKIYKRLTAYFSLKSLFSAAQGITELVNNNGKIQLIIEQGLLEADFNAIKDGYDKKAEILLDGFQEEVDKESINNDLLNKRLIAISELIANGLLDIKIAYRKHGIHHKKIGIILDHHGNKLSFSGSNNETSAAWDRNINGEDIDVHFSWTGSKHIKGHEQQFDNLWNEKPKSKYTVVKSFTEAEKEKLIKFISNYSPSTILKSETELALKNNHTENEPHIPEYFENNKFELKTHQRESLKKWDEYNYEGILELATGAGKTITAIVGAIKVFEKLNKLFLIIAVPYTHLAEQWHDVLIKFNINPTKCYDSYNTWYDDLDHKVSSFLSNTSQFECAIVVNKTFQNAKFQGLVNRIPYKNVMFIGDECHEHSTETFSNSFIKANYILGLSATPFNYIDDEKNEIIKSYYKEIIYTYNLFQAIQDGVLTPYHYHVIPVELTKSEQEAYHELSDKIGKFYAQKINNSNNYDYTNLDILFSKRAKILGSAKNKNKKLKELLEKIDPQPHSIFYCGDGKVIDESQNQEKRQIQAVTKIVNEYKWSPSHFTARENTNDRKTIFKEFKNGTIKSLVAIRCLDQGVDIPNCKTAFLLASSRNPRQFIQRRGRILRKSPGKKFATIYDFMVFIPAQKSINEHDKKLLKNEFKRVIEFSKLSLNYNDTQSKILELALSYDLEMFI